MTRTALRSTVDALLSALLPASGLDLRYTVAEHSMPAIPRLEVRFEGPDTPCLLDRRAELLHALEHLATEAARLPPEEHDHIRFDAEDYKRQRDLQLQTSASQAIARVRLTGHPWHFPPMTSRERRLLHLTLAASGLHAASEGDPPRRHIVLHPSTP